MPGLYKDEGIVLKTNKLGEADRIVTLLTRENGKIAAVAKGVRKTKSRWGARLEPFTQVELMLYKGRNLDTITGAQIVQSFDRVRKDYVLLTSAAALVEVVEKITPDRERALQTYALLLSGLRALAEADPLPSVVPAFLVKLLSVSGYHPQLSACAGCDEELPLVGFSPALGGALCEDCWREDRGALRLSSDRIALLNRLLSSEFGERADGLAIREVTQAMRNYAEYYLERPLKSLQLLAV